ncbi:MAG: primosomal protein N' [Syntrophorhabdaceae bacterium]|nr:primosomal protein N' [Syntrophorhabdaceae bacterium]
MIAEIALPLPIAKTFTYNIPEELRSFIKAFQRVVVPFRNRSILGYVIDMEDRVEEGLKDILEIVDIYPLLDDNMIKLCLWSSNQYITPFGLTLKYALPKYLKPELYLTAIIKDEELLKNFSIKAKGMAFNKTRMMFGLKNTVKYIEEGKITLYDRFTKKSFPFDLTLNESKESKKEKTVFIGSVQKRIEFYIGVMEEQIKNKRNVLMLLPDYDLSGRFFYEILKQRFGQKVFWYGSSIKQSLRMEAFFKARAETGNIILGNKSAVFLPIKNLSLIIVERHEEDSFKNESEFKFNAWEVALKRAEIEHTSVIFGSVSPKIEIFKGIDDGYFKIIEEGLPLPEKIHEIKIDKKLFFSGSVPVEILNNLENMKEHKTRIAIFTPRKYYSSHIQCINCGFVFTCPKCRSALIFKKKENKIFCSSCQDETDYREQCPECASNILRFFQFGAEYIEEMLKKMFSDAHITLFTADSVGENINNLADIEIIVGTHVLSKLYGMKYNTLICVFPEDILHLAGFRAEEKLFQTIFNILDALNPLELYFYVDAKKDFTVEQFKDYWGFYKTELKKRKLAEFPPFTNLYLMEIEKKTLKAGQKAIKTIKDRVKIWGLEEIVKGPLFEKRQRYRWKIILKGHDEKIKDFLFTLYDIQDIAIEVNPLNI